MRFSETRLPGVFVIEPEPVHDARGFFARIWCETEARDRGIDARVVQCNVSWNRRRGTLRGLHFQVAPYEEAKLVRVTRGAIFDVIVDLRLDSPTFGEYVTLELSAGNRKMVFIPQGLAHGFQTLDDETEVAYQMSTVYVAEAARGIRWSDPQLAIPWPAVEQRIVSERDRELPFFRDVLASGELER